MTQTFRTKVGIAGETAWGSGTANGAYHIIPCETPRVSINYEQILDSGLRGIAMKDFGAYQGVGHSEVTLSGMAYPDEIGYFLWGILGSVSAAAGTPTVHTMTLANEPPSFIIEDQTNVNAPGGAVETNAIKFTGMLENSLSLRFNAGEGAVSFEASFMGKIGAVGALNTIVGTHEAPFLGWYGSVSAGTVLTTKIIDTEFTFSREVAVVHTGAQTQNPSFGYHGPLEVTGRATMAFHTFDDYNKYLNNTQEELIFEFVRGSSTTLRSLRITLPKVSYLEAPMEIDRGAVDARLSVSFRGLWDSSDGDKPVIILKSLEDNYQTA